MSLERYLADIEETWAQGADLSAAPVGALLMLDTTDGRLVVTTANTDIPTHVLAATPEGSEVGFPIRVLPLISGFTYRMVANAAIALNARVTPVASGYVDDAGIGANDYVVGIALNAPGAQLDYVRVKCFLFQASA